MLPYCLMSVLDDPAKVDEFEAFVNAYKSVMMSRYSRAENLVHLELMSGPTISVNPSQLVGESDLGNISAEIQTASSAEIEYTPGSAETTLEEKGSIRNWVTEGHYDIYA